MGNKSGGRSRNCSRQNKQSYKKGIPNPFHVTGPTKTISDGGGRNPKKQEEGEDGRAMGKEQKWCRII